MLKVLIVILLIYIAHTIKRYFSYIKNKKERKVEIINLEKADYDTKEWEKIKSELEKK